jgi:hypothetical protein
MIRSLQQGNHDTTEPLQISFGHGLSSGMIVLPKSVDRSTQACEERNCQEAEPEGTPFRCDGYFKPHTGHCGPFCWCPKLRENMVKGKKLRWEHHREIFRQSSMPSVSAGKETG